MAVSYKIGSLSVANGSGAVTILGAALTGQNCTILDGIRIGAVYTKVIAKTDLTHISIPMWAGTSVVDSADWEIFFDSPARSPDASRDVSDMLALLNTGKPIYGVPGDVPDPGLGEEDDLALKADSSPWKLWKRTGGEWVLQAQPIGLDYKGEWNGIDTFLINDRVSESGTTYVAKAENTNQRPSLDTGHVYWDTAGVKGDRGATWTSGSVVPSNASGVDNDQFVLLPLFDVYKRSAGVWAKSGSIRGIDGGAVSIPYTFDGTTQSVGNPGSGKCRFNQIAQNTSTALILGLVDNLGRDFTAALDTLASGTSAVKQIARIYSAVDQSKFVLATITGVNTGVGFRALVCTIFSSSAASPFANGDALVFSFVPVGDKGDAITGPQGISYRERPYDGATTYVNNATFIDRAISDGQTWTCIVLSVTGVTPGTDATKWVLSARGVSPSVIDAATTARDQAQAALASTIVVQSAVNDTADDVAADAAAAAASATSASTHDTNAQGAVATAHGWATTAQQYADMLTDRVNDWGDGRGDLIDSTDWGDGR